MHRLLTACFASFGEMANQSIFLSVLRAEEWATDAPVTGLLQEMDWGSIAHLQSSTNPWHNLDLCAESHVVGLVGFYEGAMRPDGGCCVSVTHVESRSSAPQAIKLDLLFAFHRTE